MHRSLRDLSAKNPVWMPAKGVPSLRAPLRCVFLVLSGSLALVACVDGPTVPHDAAARIVPEPSATRRTIDDEFVDLATRAPGFGGIFYDLLGRLTVYLTNPSLRDQVNAVIREFLLRSPTNRALDIDSDLANMNVLRGEHDFAQLAAAYALITGLAADRGVTQTDIDETRNRIVIGVLDVAAMERIRAGLARLHVADDIVVVERVPPSNIVADLQGLVRPVPSSVQININVGLGGACSLGWNAYKRDGESPTGYDGKKYFVTASHCTSEFGVMSGDRFGQPDLNSPIGTEVVDPPMFTSVTNSSCPVGDRCRYSDAALVMYDDSVPWKHGNIPTVGRFAPFVITGYRTIGGEASEYDLIVGRVAEKTGRTTGRTTGTVVSSCIRVRQFVQGVPTDRVMLCQMQASPLNVLGGDSGSPVYLTDVPGGLHLTGIIWGTGTDFDVPNAPIRTTFSRWYLATSEIRDVGGAWLDARYDVCPWCGY